MTFKPFDVRIRQSAGRWLRRSAEHRWGFALALAGLPDDVTANTSESFAAFGKLHRCVRDTVVTPACTPAASADNKRDVVSAINNKPCAVHDLYMFLHAMGWCGGSLGRLSDLSPGGHGFQSRPGTAA